MALPVSEIWAVQHQVRGSYARGLIDEPRTFDK